MSQRRTLIVFGTEPSAVEEALPEVCALARPDDHVRVRLVLASWPRTPGLRDAYRWSCSDRLRDLLVGHGRADDAVVLAGGSPSRALRALVDGSPKADVLVLADGWEHLLVEALTLGPDVWLWPSARTTCTLAPEATMPAWLVAHGEDVRRGAVTEVAAPATPMEQLRWVHGRRGRSVILPGAGPQARSGWWDWFAQRRAG